MSLASHIYCRNRAANKNQSEQKRDRWINFLSVTAIVGVIIGIGGVLLNALIWFGLVKNQFWNGLGVWLLFLIFPFLWYTAHCLDKIDEADRQIRRERLKSIGFKELK